MTEFAAASRMRIVCPAETPRREIVSPAPTVFVAVFVVVPEQGTYLLAASVYGLVLQSPAVSSAYVAPFTVSVMSLYFMPDVADAIV